MTSLEKLGAEQPKPAARIYWDEETHGLRSVPTRHGWHRELVDAKDYDALYNSFASLSAMNEAMRVALSRIRNVVKHSSHTAGALSTIRAAIDALPPEVLP